MQAKDYLSVLIGALLLVGAVSIHHYWSINPVPAVVLGCVGIFFMAYGVQIFNEDLGSPGL